MDTGLASGNRAIFKKRTAGRRRDRSDQVRKMAIRARIKMTAAVPYFTSLMKPS
jgi:hypothetical protein